MERPLEAVSEVHIAKGHCRSQMALQAIGVIASITGPRPLFLSLPLIVSSSSQDLQSSALTFHVTSSLLW